MGGGVHNLRAIVLELVTSLLAVMGPSNFHLLGPPKQYMVGKQFAADGNVKQTVTVWLVVVPWGKSLDCQR